MIQKIIFGLGLLLMFSQQSVGQHVVLPLYQGEIPNYVVANVAEQSDTSGIIRISKVQNPTISVFLPSKEMATGQAVVICPGGGYKILAFDKEGTDVAKWLNSLGIAGIVLKNRLPDAETSVVRYKSPLLDVQRAIRITRVKAQEWHIDRNKVGVMGFSAGGHLASTAGTHFAGGDSLAGDLIERFGCRPDFMILGYPVISMADAVTHKGSKRNLLGENPSVELVQEFSNELQVTKETPPTFLFLASNDKVVLPENSISFYKALNKCKVPAEMHIYPVGKHGFGLAIGKGPHEGWTKSCEKWLKWINGYEKK